MSWYYKYQVIYWDESSKFKAAGIIHNDSIAGASQELETFYGDIESLTITCLMDFEGNILEDSCEEIIEEK